MTIGGVVGGTDLPIPPILFACALTELRKTLYSVPMKNHAWLFRTLLVTLLLFAQHGALAHALKHTTEPYKVTAHAELCSQCLDFAQAGAAPLGIHPPKMPAHVCEGALRISSSSHLVLSDSPSFNFQSRAPPLSFT